MHGSVVGTGYSGGETPALSCSALTLRLVERRQPTNDRTRWLQTGIENTEQDQERADGRASVPEDAEACAVPGTALQAGDEEVQRLRLTCAQADGGAPGLHPG